MAVLLASLKVPLSWPEILERTFHEAFYKDNCLGMAAQLAYYFFFGLFPALLVMLAIASYFPVETLVVEMFDMLGGFVPPEAIVIITDQIKKISEGQQGGLLTIGMLTALWSLPAPAPSGASYWMLGAGIVIAQAWLALKALRNKKISA